MFPCRGEWVRAPDRSNTWRSWAPSCKMNEETINNPLGYLKDWNAMVWPCSWGYLLKDSFYSLWAVECRPVEACAVLWSAKKRNPQVFLICSVNLKTPVLHNNWYFAFWMDRNWRSICHKTSMTKDVVNIFHVWERRSKLMARVNFKF